MPEIAEGMKYFSVYEAFIELSKCRPVHHEGLLTTVVGSCQNRPLPAATPRRQADIESCGPR